jgi:hypothetical protein
LPRVELIIEPVEIRGVADDGDISLDPPQPGLARVPLRRLTCYLRVPLVPGAQRAVIDTGAALSYFPHQVWANDFRWREGRDFDTLPVAGNPPLVGQTLGFRYSFRLVRLRVPVTLAGRDLTAPRLQVDSLVTQLAEPGGPPVVLLGLWGGVLDGRRLAFATAPDGVPSAALDWD